MGSRQLVVKRHPQLLFPPPSGRKRVSQASRRHVNAANVSGSEEKMANPEEPEEKIG